jgi:hypothetical protein
MVRKGRTSLVRYPSLSVDSSLHLAKADCLRLQGILASHLILSVTSPSDLAFGSPTQDHTRTYQFAGVLCINYDCDVHQLRLRCTSTTIALYINKDLETMSGPNAI